VEKMMFNWLYEFGTMLWQNGTVCLIIGYIIIGYGAGWVITGTQRGKDYGQVVFRVSTKTENGMGLLNTSIAWDGVPMDPTKPLRPVFKHHRHAMHAFEDTVHHLENINDYFNNEEKEKGKD
jgi:hypothetical protein